MNRPPPPAVTVNSGSLGRTNIILSARSREHHVSDFAGPLSIKSVVRGEAIWRAGRSRFLVDSSSFLVLNEGQPYSLDLQSSTAVETLCVFFRRGEVENACRSLTAKPGSLLEQPHQPATSAAAEFHVQLWRMQGRIPRVLGRLRHAVARQAGPEILEALVCELALALARLRPESRREMERVPAVRPATREELWRRLHAGKKYLDDTLDRPVRLAEAARAACLSPFHFHRLFHAAFQETPHGYALQRRLERAARLLRETEAPVAHVSLAAGFESPGSFSSLFRTRFGASPGQFRRMEKSKIREEVLEMDDPKYGSR